MTHEASPWDHDRNIRSGAQMREYRAVADRLVRDLPRAAVLDWGCGYGHVSDLMVERGLAVTAFEYDPVRNERRPLELYPQLEVTLSSEPVALPFDDARFDAVLSCGVLEHVTDPPASLQEIQRVLKPGGVLYVYKLANRHSYLEKLAKRMGLYYHGQYPNDRLYTLPEARALLQDNGYQVKEIRMANMLPLTFLTGRPGKVLGGLIWSLNRLLARVPGLNRFATNVELVAVPSGVSRHRP